MFVKLIEFQAMMLLYDVHQGFTLVHDRLSNIPLMAKGDLAFQKPDVIWVN
jgi:hypothetical protein